MATTTPASHATGGGVSPARFLVGQLTPAEADELAARLRPVWEMEPATSHERHPVPVAPASQPEELIEVLSANASHGPRVLSPSARPAAPEPESSIIVDPQLQAFAGQAGGAAASNPAAAPPTNTRVGAPAAAAAPAEAPRSQRTSSPGATQKRKSLPPTGEGGARKSQTRQSAPPSRAIPASVSERLAVRPGGGKTALYAVGGGIAALAVVAAGFMFTQTGTPSATPAPHTEESAQRSEAAPTTPAVKPAPPIPPPAPPQAKPTSVSAPPAPVAPQPAAAPTPAPAPAPRAPQPAAAAPAPKPAAPAAPKAAPAPHPKPAAPKTGAIVQDVPF